MHGKAFVGAVGFYFESAAFTLAQFKRDRINSLFIVFNLDCRAERMHAAYFRKRVENEFFVVLGVIFYYISCGNAFYRAVYIGKRAANVVEQHSFEISPVFSL